MLVQGRILWQLNSDQLDFTAKWVSLKNVFCVCVWLWDLGIVDKQLEGYNICSNLKTKKLRLRKFMKLAQDTK